MKKKLQIVYLHKQYTTNKTIYLNTNHKFFSLKNLIKV